MTKILPGLKTEKARECMGLHELGRENEMFDKGKC